MYPSPLLPISLFHVLSPLHLSLQRLSTLYTCTVGTNTAYRFEAETWNGNTETVEHANNQADRLCPTFMATPMHALPLVIHTMQPVPGLLQNVHCTCR